jgi:CO/xanthine dehydrogenase Mo-binding subunit
MSTPSAIIGTSVPRIEGPDKVTGRAKYAGDVDLPGMLWGKILRSTVSHGRIRRIDASKAWTVPGVRAVVTGVEEPGHYFGKILRDMPVLCWDRVRYVGDRVAAVAADSPDAAEEALKLMDVEYEELPAVFDPVEAMQPNAPLLHDDVAAYDGFPVFRRADDLHNGQTRLAWSKGDVEQGFREADIVLEHTFRIPSRIQGYLEPYASVIKIEDDGHVEAWCSTKSPFRARIQLAQAVGIPEESIRLNVVNVGGDFGGKGDARDLPVAYLLAQRCGSPVKIISTYAEELTAANPTHPTVVIVKSGVRRDGSLTARQVRTIHASGAYGGMKPNAALSTWHYVGGPYRLANSSFEFLQVYTNHVPGGYFRAPGAHQYTFALESHTDLLAAAVGMDPVAFRRHNVVYEGEEDAVGNKLRLIKAHEVMDAALAGAGWGREKPSPLFGRGVGIFGRQIGGGLAGVVLTAETDGTFTLISPTVDVGTGTHTVMKQVVANEMGVGLDQVRVVGGDTETAPFDEGPRASRVTYTEGTVVMKACQQIKNMIADGAGLPLTVTQTEDVPHVQDTMYFGAQVAEVEVDPETGAVKVHRVVTAHDVGTVINPVTHQGQINGGFITGYGLAMTEELVMQEGRIINGNLGDYKLPCIIDIPQFETVLVESPGGIGPYASKSIGELSNNATPAAIANAVADAIGVRLFELPVTSERVYAAIQAKKAQD